MSTHKTENGAHDNRVNIAETARQAAVLPTATKAQIVTAETTFMQEAARSAIANNCSPSVFLQALRAQGRDLWS